MDSGEEDIVKREKASQRSLRWYYSHKEEIAERRRSDREYKMKHSLYQHAYYLKRKALMQKQAPKLKIQSETVQTQQEPVFEVSFA